MPVTCSHCNQQRLEPFFGDRQVIVLKDGNVEADRFADIVDRFRSGSALADATEKLYTPGHPVWMVLFPLGMFFDM